MIQEFRDFILRGNVVDLAVAVVIGAAFGAVVGSFVGDILTPLLGIIGLPDLTSWSVRVGPADVRYGAFLTTLISFLLIAAAIFFFVVRPVNRLNAVRRTEPDASAPTKDCPECLSSIPEGARRCLYCTSPQPA
jgi:large conductance mechanosensitive channel